MHLDLPLLRLSLVAACSTATCSCRAVQERLQLAGAEGGVEQGEQGAGSRVPALACPAQEQECQSSASQRGLCQPITPCHECSLHPEASESSQKFLPAEALRREQEPLTPSHELLASPGFCSLFFQELRSLFPRSGGSLAPELSCRQEPDRAFSHHMHCSASSPEDHF